MADVFTYSEARQNFATLLKRAKARGEVKVRRKDGQIFVIRPESANRSPLDVKGVDIEVTTRELIAFVRESRKR